MMLYVMFFVHFFTNLRTSALAIAVSERTLDLLGIAELKNTFCSATSQVHSRPTDLRPMNSNFTHSRPTDS